MGKYVIKRRIPKLNDGSTVVAPAAGSAGISGLGMEPVVSSSPGFVSSLQSISNDMYNKFMEPLQGEVDELNAKLEEERKGLFNSVMDDFQKKQGTGGTDETNVYDFTTIPYYGASDIGSRAMQFGRGIGRMTSDGYGDLSGGAKAANTAGTVFSGLGMGLGLAREIFSGVASAQGNATNMRLAQERENRQRRNSQIQYGKEGGGVYLSPGNRFDTGSLTGEYMYPLPKSMTDQANVEIEKGEYVVQPGDTPKESLGQAHADGGTPVSLEVGTKVITDDTTIEPDFAKFIRETYGIAATPKDTYSTIMDRYKKKIGLKSAYEDQQKALKRLDKNNKIEDPNTRRLNESVISKAISDSNDTISGLENRFTDFANMVYEEQEGRKNKEYEDTYLAKGGEIHKRLEEAKSKYGLTDKDIAGIKKDLIGKVSAIRQKMATGGSPFGHLLNVRFIENEYNNPSNTFNYQRITGNDGNTQYGGVGDNNWLGVYEWMNPDVYAAYNNAANGEGAAAIQRVISAQDRARANLSSMENMLGNAKALKDWNALVSFGGEDSKGNYPNTGESAYHDRSLDGKLGRFTTSRPMIALDVVSMEQKRALDKAGITHFSQLFKDENKDTVAKILGDDMDNMVAFRSMEGLEGLDFMLDAYNPELQADMTGVDVKKPTPDLSPISKKPVVKDPAVKIEPDPKDPKDKTKPKGDVNRNVMAAGLDFPEMFRMTPGSVTTEGLERHYAPTVDPVLRSSDQYMVEMNRSFNSQLDQMGQVPDSQRGALQSNLQAIMGSNIGKYINEIEQANVAQRTAARNFNEQAWKQTDDQNIAERLRYQSGILQGQAINEENWNRYFDSVNDEIQQKWSANTSMNTLRSIFGDVAVGPNGQIYADPRGQVLAPRRLDPVNYYAMSNTKKKKG